MKYVKKLLAIFFAVIFVFQSMGSPLTVYAETESVIIGTRESAGSITVTMEEGLKANLEGRELDGTNVVEVSESSDIKLFQNNISSANALKISITFRLASDASGDYFNLFEICNSQKNTTPAETIGLIVSKTGKVFLMTGTANGGTDWQVDSNQSIADGNLHTLTLKVTANALSFQMDGGAEKSINADGNRQTKSFVQAFFGKTAGEYTDWRNRIDTITIGGFCENSFLTNSAFHNLNGEITSFSIAGANEVTDNTGSGLTSGMFARDSLDNTWLFGGGVETQGRFAEIGGVRNYIGHFEEYVRWVKRVDGVLLGMQRYVINTGKENQDAISFAQELEDLIAKVKPKAVSYLIGPEDYSNGDDGVAAFKEGIADIIEKALAMNENTGYVVIQLPHAVKDATTASNVTLYANAAKEAFREIAVDNEQKADRMLLVNHLEQTDNDNFKNSNLTQTGLLNANGHHEIAKQFSQAVFGASDNFPAISGSWTAVEAPETYLDVVPEIMASSNELEIKIPGQPENASFKYILTIDDTEIKGDAAGNPFTITELPAGELYQLVIQTQDKSTQYAAVSGRINSGEQAVLPKAEGSIQQAIQDKVNNTNEPLTWLFMGDSITHAAQHTAGYDGIAQLFEKYLKEDLKRTDDIVINTSVSGATAARTIENLEQRMTKYHPDIVSIMLGTNDAGDASVFSAYKDNLKNIVRAIRSENSEAIIIFRSPTPGTGRWATGPAGEDGSVARMKAVAEEDGNILFIDQYTDWNTKSNAYPYLNNNAHLLGDGAVHPGPAGHVLMTTQFIRECGMNENTRIANLSYQFQYTKTDSSVQPEVIIADNQAAVTIHKNTLQTAFGTAETIGDMTVVLTDSNGRTYTKCAGLDEDSVNINNLPKGSYTVSVTANIKGNTPKYVAFAEKNISLAPVYNDQDAADEVIAKINGIGTVDASDKCGEKIKAARDAYESLTATQKALVSAAVVNLLEEAEQTYAELKQEKIDQDAADEVMDLITAIGDITLTEDCEKKIQEAREAYKSLTAVQKDLISDEIYDILEQAEETYQKLEEEKNKEDSANKEAAESVIEKIKAIGTVDATQASQLKIKSARDLYLSLSDSQKALIPEDILDILETAEKTYDTLKKAADEKANQQKRQDQNAANMVISKIRSIGTVTNTAVSKAKIDAARTAYNRLTAAQKALIPVATLRILTNAESTLKRLQQTATQPKPPVPSIVEGTKFSYQNYNFIITSVSKQTVQLVSAINKKQKKIKIPDEVEYSGKKYKVTAIAPAALKNNRKATSLVIGNNVEIVGNQAFAGCKTLKKIEIKSKVLKSVGKKAWKGISKKAVMKVPAGKFKEYKKLLAGKGQSKTVKIKK